MLWLKKGLEGLEKLHEHISSRITPFNDAARLADNAKKIERFFNVASNRLHLAMQYYKPKTFLLLLVVLCAATASAQSSSVTIRAEREYGVPRIKTYTPKEYGEHSQNWATLQDRRGVLYFANGHGVLEYDGAAWRLIETSKGARVRSLAQGRNGTIYVGASGDFGYLAADETGQLGFVSLLPKLKEEDRDFTEVWRTHCTSDAVYFQTFNALFRWANNRMQVWKPFSAFFLSAVLDDTLYIEDRQNGLMKMVGDSLHLISGSASYLPLRMLTMLPFDEKRALIATAMQGLLLFDGNAFAPFPNAAENFLRENNLSSATILPNGEIALGTYRGGAAIIDRHGGLRQILNLSSGLQNDDVKHLFVDTHGALWLACNYGIAQVQTSSPFSYFTETQGLEGLVSAIARHQGVLYAATSQGLFYLNKKSGRFRPIAEIGFEAFSLLRFGELLLVGTNHGVYRISDGNVSSLPQISGPAFVLCRSVRDSNIVHVGLADGLATLRYHNGAWQNLGRVEDVHQQVRSIVALPNGALWLGTGEQGVVRVRFDSQSGHSNAAQVERLGRDLILPAGQIAKVNEHVLFAAQNGLRRFDESTHTFVLDSTFGSEAADSTRWFVRFATLGTGNVLIHSGKKNIGEYWWAQLQSNNSFLLDKNRFRPLLHFGTVYSSYTEDDGLVWLGCNTGLVQYDSAITQKTDAPTPIIRRVSTIHNDSLVYGGHAAERFTPPILPYRMRAVQFEFALPSFIEAAENEFQYLLEGFDKDWSLWTRGTKKDYTNLPEGEYTFRLRARNVFLSQGMEASFAFKVLPPWYRSWWAYAFYVACFGAGLFIVDRTQRARLTRREQEKAKLREAEITQQKNFELRDKNEQLERLLLELKATQTQLARSESRFRSVAQSAHDAIITANSTGRITFWNSRAETMFGYSQQEALGQPLTILMPERYRAQHVRGMDRFLLTGQAHIIGSVVEVHAVRKDGAEFPIELTVAAWQIDDGKFVTGIIRDITRRKQQQEKVEQAQKLLAAENERKTEQLEKARQLQLAMLPKEIPQLPYVAIEAYMKTAMEVGGDYYDFQTGTDGGLTVVIGDATGHGLNAGMMVTATKSIFETMADEPDLTKLFSRMNRALKRVNLEKHYMALQVLKLKDYQLEICAAGMPPVLIYRAATRAVEEITLKAMPLGSFAEFSYQKRSVRVAPGDTVLLMSDGFPELFNAQKEVFEETRVQMAFAEAATQSPREIIAHLLRAGEAWADGAPQHDDLTFVVLRVK